MTDSNFGQQPFSGGTHPVVSEFKGARRLQKSGDPCLRSRSLSMSLDKEELCSPLFHFRMLQAHLPVILPELCKMFSI